MREEIRGKTASGKEFNIIPKRGKFLYDYHFPSKLRKDSKRTKGQQSSLLLSKTVTMISHSQSKGSLKKSQ